MTQEENTPVEKSDQPAEPAAEEEERPAAPEQKPKEKPEKAAGFPIVGIGASAGGLEALETFFAHMSPTSGMAFVVIQHLDPTHKSILLELLQRHTKMKVTKVDNGLPVTPNCIYVIPPNRDMTIKQGRLYLAEPKTTHGLNIDIFLRSLARDQADRAIGVILSGAGSDGSLGLKAIKEIGGLVLAQEPNSAKYDGMPQSAISTGMVDYILRPEEMPEQLEKYIKLAPFTAQARPVTLLPEGSDALHQIFALLRAQVGHDFSMYKKNTIRRRIERRMAVKQIIHVDEYIQLLHQNGSEVQALFKELLIGVTSFFRDGEAFRVLEQKVIPQLFEERRYDQPIRVWAPGCATGEEAYCLAMLLQEQMTTLKREIKVQLFATDIDEESIERARQGLYPLSIATDVSPERLQRFFVEMQGAYQVTDQLRRMVVYATQSVIKDPPFSKLDFISCRNLLIYLEPQLQKKVMALLYHALKPGGYLLLGTSETPVDLTPFFTPIDRKWKIYQRPATGPDRLGMQDMMLPAWSTPDSPAPELTRQPDTRRLMEKLILERYVQPCMVINEQHEILYIYGRVGKFLEPAVGQVGHWSILRLVREELRMPVGAAVRQAVTQKETAKFEDVLIT